VLALLKKEKKEKRMPRAGPKMLNAMLIEDRPGNRRVLIDFFAMR
jgi:hypothetical protein